MAQAVGPVRRCCINQSVGCVCFLPVEKIIRITAGKIAAAVYCQRVAVGVVCVYADNTVQCIGQKTVVEVICICDRRIAPRMSQAIASVVVGKRQRVVVVSSGYRFADELPEIVVEIRRNFAGIGCFRRNVAVLIIRVRERRCERCARVVKPPAPPKANYFRRVGTLRSSKYKQLY